jgi:hypothetical protein
LKKILRAVTNDAGQSPTLKIKTLAWSVYMRKHALGVVGVLIALSALAAWTDDKAECAAGIEMLKAAIVKEPAKQLLVQLQKGAQGCATGGGRRRLGRMCGCRPPRQEGDPEAMISSPRRFDLRT